MPESVPGPKSFSGSSGKPARTSFQLSTFEPVSQIFFSSAVVRQFAHVFCWLTTIERPSFATVKAMHLTPFVAALDGLGALHRARRVREVGLALQKRSKPPPVPEMPTVTRTPLFFFWKRFGRGGRVRAEVLEPSAVIVPLERA